MQFADERGPHGEVWRRDFGPFMLKEYIAYSAPLRHTFRVLFGVSVEVSSGDFAAREAQAVEAEQSGANLNEGKKPEANWRRDFSDPLWWRAAARPAAASVYEMAVGKVPEIFGDGCAAQVDDVAAAAAEGGARHRPLPAVRAARRRRPRARVRPAVQRPRENGCTLRLMLALRARRASSRAAAARRRHRARRRRRRPRRRPRRRLRRGGGGAAAHARRRRAGAHLSLTHGARAGAPRLAVRPRTAATAVAAVGVLRAAAPPTLRIACTCAAPTAVANVTVTLVVVDAVTSPTFSVLVPCAKA